MMLGAGVLAAACGSLGQASAQEFGNWTVGAGQGYVEHTVRSGLGNSFIISCDESASDQGEPKKTSIYVELAGKAPRPNTGVVVALDKDKFNLNTDAQGGIPTDCRACSDNFRMMWTKLRKATTMVVTLADGRSATFSLNGAARALSLKPCTTGFKG
ncbi:hypothetical protein Q8W71_04645 [Methylobacterium sp. NEAU 140]|uniref:hypothetical protein n=1 Tax=Methylobacterium sp. NEAU 140 TaxID=3064945 RepID=UPI002735C96F|nr:hypothetical protein [Methylobacterium sp. NEAU 140]MDP4021906.1 hypothetical protein [Methylobacterium sp. NEAU 140]